MSISKTITPAPIRTVAKYGAEWPETLDPLQIELKAIRWGGRWNSPGPCGEGLLHHYMEARRLIWPLRFRHRWTDLIYDQVLKNQITILTGCASSGKSSSLAEIALISYWASPQNTAVIISSTTREKLDLAVWAECKMLWEIGTLRYPWLAGNVIEYKMCITTDDLETKDIRDFRKGIKCVACMQGKTYVGLGQVTGLKQDNLWFLADELSWMSGDFLEWVPNARSNVSKPPCVGFKLVGSGNPNHDPESQLSIVAEPLDGWGSVESNEKTSVWPIKLSGGVCVNLIGTDSPNFDQPEDIFPKLIGHAFEETLRVDYGLDSPEYETQIKGRMKTSLATCRVITRQLCRDHQAHDKAVWEGNERTRIHACDPAYGGGDRCISMWGEFGMSAEKQPIIRIGGVRIVRIDLKLEASPEDQIAESIKQELDNLGIPPENSRYDSFGRGTIGNAFAKVFGKNCPQPVDAGQRPSKRPVRDGLYVVDEATHEKRLKRCDEEYGKFITELWFAVRNIIEAGQMRELPLDVMTEGCTRQYFTVAGNKKDVEPKDKMRLLKGKSPDLMDCCAQLVECARQLGFQIGKLGATVQSDDADDDYLERESERYRRIINSCMLQR